MKKLLTRRDFLTRVTQTALALGGGVFLNSCKGHRPHYDVAVWAQLEDISDYADGSLEGIFAINPELETFSINGGDFIGRTFDHETNGQKRSFTIVDFETDVPLTEEYPNPRIKLSLMDKDRNEIFDSEFDLAGRDETRFSGLERVLLVTQNPNGTRGYTGFKAENRYNGETQTDAYFRVRAGIDFADCLGCAPPHFIIRNIEKLRVLDAARTRAFEIRPISSWIEDEAKIEHEADKVEQNIDQTLKNGFSIEFPFTLQFPVSNQKGFFIPREYLSYAFSHMLPNGKKKELVARYLAVNPKANFAMAELLEEPKVEHFEFDIPRKIEYMGREYVLRVKGFRGKSGYIDMPEIVLDVENEGDVREVVVSGADPLNPNKTPWFNIDPDLSLYWGRPEHEIRGLRVHRFLLSRDKVSVPGFYSSKYHTGIRKQIVSDGNLKNPVFTQLTIGTRYNGDIQENAYSKIGAECDGKIFVVRGLEKIVV